MDTKQIISTSIGIFSSVLFLDYFAKNTNTVENRKKIMQTITKNTFINGFSQLLSYLNEDGFVKGKYISPPNINSTTVLEIGEGGGKTRIGGSGNMSLDNWLRNLTASKLDIVVNKAINDTPRGDTVNDRQLVMTWIKSYQGAVNNMDKLYSDLNTVNWINKNPKIPPDSDIPQSLLLGDSRIVLYHKFLTNSVTSEVLEKVNNVVYPKDKNLEERELTFLICSESADSNVTGFVMFRSFLSASGFIKSPQQYTPVKNLPDTLLLGGTTLTSSELTHILENATPESINAIISQALHTVDPTLQPRINAMAELNKNMNTYKIISWQPNTLSDMYTYLKTSGFLTSPRTFKPVDDSKFKGTVFSYGWLDIPDLNKYLKNATYKDISNLAELGQINSVHYDKWRASRTGEQNNISVGIYGDPQIAQINSQAWNSLYQGGLMYSPPHKSKWYYGGFEWIRSSSTDEDPTFIILDDDDKLNGIWSGLPSADYLVINFFIGTEPNRSGLFVKTDNKGNPNKHYKPAGYNEALKDAKTSDFILLPK